MGLGIRFRRVVADAVDRLHLFEPRSGSELPDALVRPGERTLRFGNLQDAEAVPGHLRRDVRLGPVHEGSAELHVDAGERGDPGPAPEAFPRFEHRDASTSVARARAPRSAPRTRPR